jgi:hypothetical protein
MRGAWSFLLAILAASVVAACGSSATSSPMGSALSYFPRDSPFALSVVTDPNPPAVKHGQAMLAQIPFASFGQATAISRLQQLGINYDTDIRPLFGNPVLLGVEGPSASGSTRNKLLIAWITRDAGTLSSLVKELHLSQVGSHDGATPYQVSTLTLAVDGATLVAGGSTSTVDAALDRHSGGGGMTIGEFNSELGNLPKDALISAVGNLGPTLSASPRTAKARSVPWVAALHGVAISARSGGLTFQYTLNTTGGSLSSSELPIAPGTSPPGLAGNMPIQVGLREPAATINFQLDVERRTQPAQYRVIWRR